MKRLYIIFATALFCMGCMAQKTNWNDSVLVYTEQARWGDATAYEKLAECYIPERGVAQEGFLQAFNLLAMAGDYDGKDHIGAFVNRLPADNANRTFYKALDAAERGDVESAIVLADTLSVMGFSTRAKTVRALAANQQGRNDVYFRLIKETAAEGCEIARSYLCVNDESTWTFEEKIATLQQMSATSPIAYVRMGELYAQIGEKEKAARYFVEADKHACLDYRNASNLLEYSQSGELNLKLDEQDIHRWQTLISKAYEAWKNKKY